jgi:hypothetical protein
MTEGYKVSRDAHAVRESAYLNCSERLHFFQRVHWLSSLGRQGVMVLLANHGTLRFIAAKKKRPAGVVVPARHRCPA